MLMTNEGELIGNVPRARRIIRRHQLPAVTGYSIPYLYELISAGEFPAPIPLGKRAVGWLEDEIAAWQASRIAKRASSQEVA